MNSSANCLIVFHLPHYWQYNVMGSKILFMKKLREYSDKELQSLTKLKLRTLIEHSTTKVYRALQIMQKQELVKLAKSLKK